MKQYTLWLKLWLQIKQNATIKKHIRYKCRYKQYTIKSRDRPQTTNYFIADCAFQESVDHRLNVRNSYQSRQHFCLRLVIKNHTPLAVKYLLTYLSVYYLLHIAVSPSFAHTKYNKRQAGTRFAVCVVLFRCCVQTTNVLFVFIFSTSVQQTINYIHNNSSLSPSDMLDMNIIIAS